MTMYQLNNNSELERYERDLLGSNWYPFPWWLAMEINSTWTTNHGLIRPS